MGIPTGASSPSAPSPPPSWPSSSRSMGGDHLWSTLAFWGRAVGFLLVFVGTLVAVVFAAIPSSCFSGSCPVGSTYAGQINGLLTARILWSLGLLFLGGAAGIKLQSSFSRRPESTSEDPAWAADRRLSRILNGLLALLAIVLLFVLLLSMGSPIPPVPP